ncbi:MAG: DUF2953 domain-containing protein [Lawsonibacter sp.]|jgi:hypothetical protein|nr:DUF2953 domain-containing protein [Lawsonibacter sp.]MCI9567426.1 DUF2953 domain-containing protein [Lawsonibacter sp.]
MRALYILAAVVLVLFLIGQVRVGGRAELSEAGFFLWIRLGTVRIQILPGRSGKEPLEPKRSKKNGQKAPRKKGPSVPAAEKAGGALEYAKALLPVALEAAGGLWRSFRTDMLELRLTAGGRDPADTALLYGRACAALGALWDPLTRAFHVKDGSARVELDFEAPGIKAYVLASFSLKLGNAVWIGLRAGWKALIGALAARKRLKLKRQQRKAA